MTMNDFFNAPANWAGELALSESEAFEKAINAIKVKPGEKEKFGDYDRGYNDGYKTAEKRFEAIVNENEELRKTVKIQSDQITKLRESVHREMNEF